MKRKSSLTVLANKYKEEISIVDYIKQYKEHPDRKCTYQAKCEEHKQPLEFYCYTCNKAFCETKQYHECRGFANYDRDCFDSWKMNCGYPLEEAKEREKKCEEFLDVYFIEGGIYEERAEQRKN